MRVVFASLVAVLLALVPVPARAQGADNPMHSGFTEEMGGLQVGGLYSVNLGERNFRVAKVLALNRYAVHVRVYGNHFASRPTNVDPATLEIRGIGDPRGWGIGHLPLSWELFASWQPHFIQTADITPDDLDGLEAWQREQGGVWIPSGMPAIRRMLTRGR
jgi:hypothetical protein